MDIKMMHEMIEKLTECAKSEMDKKGIEEIDTEEFGKATDIIKDLAEAMYYRTLTEAMKESEYGEDYDKYGPMDDGKRGYRGRPRDSRGRYMSRRGYESRMMPDMGYDEMERMRDYDRESGKMYYSGSGYQSGSGTGTSGFGGGQRGYSESRNDGKEGRSGSARRGYMESKESHKDNSSESKQAKMKELENYMKSMAEDLTEAIEGASPEERAMAKNKLSVLVQKM